MKEDEKNSSQSENEFFALEGKKLRFLCNVMIRGKVSKTLNAGWRKEKLVQQGRE
jgi:hypothetical protein